MAVNKKNPAPKNTQNPPKQNKNQTKNQPTKQINKTTTTTKQNKDDFQGVHSIQISKTLTPIYQITCYVNSLFIVYFLMTSFPPSYLSVRLEKAHHERRYEALSVVYRV